MTFATNMAAAIAELERLMRELHSVSRRSDSNRKHDLVRLRLLLAQQLPVIAAAAETFPPLADPALAHEFRERFSAMRTAIALHQATWPAVAIDDGGAPYARSAANVRQKNEEFLAWIRMLMAHPGR